MNAENESPITAILSPEEQEAQESLHRLPTEVQTAILGTVDGRGTPEASYAPYVLDDNGFFFVYVSALARHTANLKRTGLASFMLIRDESCTDNLHARARATWNCSVEVISRDASEFDSRIAHFRNRFGETMDTLAQMQDFSLFRLSPESGRLVLGFGKAYRLEGWAVQSHLRGRHRPGNQD